METYFRIRFEFDKNDIFRIIDKTIEGDRADYVCVADGNVLATTHVDEAYLRLVNGGLFSICDGSWTAVFIRLIHGVRRESYTGSQIFADLLARRKYRMLFMGGSTDALAGLRDSLLKRYPEASSWEFMELPFLDVKDFDYPRIADHVNRICPDIVWIGLGAPKQEMFMNRLRPHLRHGVMVGVGAVFNFYSERVKRAPLWMRRMHLEFLHRLCSEPGKQFPKFRKYVSVLPSLLRQEYALRR